MSRDYQLTHTKLLYCAKDHFLKNGFEKASIREICKDAHVTNGAFYNHFKDKESLFGALVEPIIEEITNMYTDSVKAHLDSIDTSELTSIWNLSESTIIKIIEYIYNNFDLFKLLIIYSDGTKYAYFLDSIVRIEVKESISFFNEIKRRGIHINDVDEDEWHMLIHAYYSSLSEVVMHNYSKESALKYAHTLVSFFSAGWQRILGI